MVIAKAEYGTSSPESPNECPKCGSQLRKTYDDQEPECWMCGFVDYSYVYRSTGPKSLIATGTYFLVRYIGGFPEMKDRLVHMRAMRGSGVAKISHLTKCPFCEQTMQAVAISIKRKQVSEDRYICSEGHRISLLQGQNGELGWK